MMSPAIDGLDRCPLPAANSVTDFSCATRSQQAGTESDKINGRKVMSSTFFPVVKKCVNLCSESSDGLSFWCLHKRPRAESQFSRLGTEGDKEPVLLEKYSLRWSAA
jgi:hypothetical protein